MSEIQKLLEELRRMQSTSKNIPNTKEVWAHIIKKDWLAAGFDNEEEAKSWIEQNAYENL